jgi:hypothetical protein
VFSRIFRLTSLLRRHLDDRPPVIGREQSDDGLELFFDHLLCTSRFSLRERFAYAEYDAESCVERCPGLACNNRGRFSEESATLGMTYPVNTEV